MAPKQKFEVPSVISEGREAAVELVKNNIENFVGFTKVPIGIAGPVRVLGDYANGDFVFPIATTEASVVASVSRGCRMISEAGGARVKITRAATVARAPAFEFDSAANACNFAQQIQDCGENWLRAKEAGERTTRHGRVVGVNTFVIGHWAHVRIKLDPQDASGQNMVSIAARAIAGELARADPACLRFVMEGGFALEKRPNAEQMLLGRGCDVAVEVTVAEDILMRLTRCSGAALAQFANEVNVPATYSTGSPYNGFACNNFLVAVGLATGQDIAAAAETKYQSIVRYDAELKQVNWQMMVYNLMVGTIGGGCGLPSQQAALELMTCAGIGQKGKLQELLAVGCLAQDLSFWSAINADEYVSAHERLARKSGGMKARL